MAYLEEGAITGARAHRRPTGTGKKAGVDIRA
jgi:hypothetical protein